MDGVILKVKTNMHREKYTCTNIRIHMCTNQTIKCLKYAYFFIFSYITFFVM